MIIEIATSIAMGGVLTWVYADKRGRNDGDKIQKIAKYSGLIKKDGKETHTIHLLAKREEKWGNEYIYRIPLGLCFQDFKEKRQNFEDGLNIRTRLWKLPTLKEIKRLKLDDTLLKQIRKLVLELTPRKEVDMEYDGTLKIKVYNGPMTKKIPVTEEDINECKGWKVWVGNTRHERLYMDFEKRPHMIIAGGTGFGKSEMVKLIVCTLSRIQPENVKFHLIDLKGGTELGQFRHMKQVEDFGRRPEDAEEILVRVKEDMDNLLDDLYEKGFNGVKQAGIKERHFVIIDEAADIANKKKCMDMVTDIARRGRSAGYRLIYATQYPTNETLPSQVRANIGSRIVFRLETGAQSLACLDEKGAESLPEIEGRAIFRQVTNKVVHTPLIGQDLIDETIKINLRPRSENVEFTKRAETRQDTIKFEKP